MPQTLEAKDHFCRIRTGEGELLPL